MQLSYHTGDNVGDALNPLLFEHLLGKDFFDQSHQTHLIGIGTILGLKRSLPGKKIVFSSGCSDETNTYGDLPSVDENYDIRAVRGPLTASALGLDRALAITDGAYLMPDVLKRDSTLTRSHNIGFAPHHKSLGFHPFWQELCESAGMMLLDVRLPPERFIRNLWTCKLVISEAMHGAILADAYRIPWIPIRLYPHINEFKWQDWAQSLSITLAPRFAPTTLATARFYSELLMKRRVPGWLSPALAKIIISSRKKTIKRWLKELAFQQGILSDSRLLTEAVDKLRIEIDRIKADYRPYTLQ